MKDFDLTPAEQRAYWNEAAPTKEFAHPFRPTLLEPHVPRDARVLDLGCGTGRVTAEIRSAGWCHVVGADTAPGMVALGRRRHPELDLQVIAPGRLPWDDQEDARNVERYRRGRERYEADGVFELPEGVVLRHFRPGTIAELFAGFERVSLEDLDVVTMNGNVARGFQLLARRPERAAGVGER